MSEMWFEDLWVQRVKKYKSSYYDKIYPSLEIFIKIYKLIKFKNHKIWITYIKKRLAVLVNNEEKLAYFETKEYEYAKRSSSRNLILKKKLKTTIK